MGCTICHQRALQLTKNSLLMRNWSASDYACARSFLDRQIAERRFVHWRDEYARRYRNHSLSPLPKVKPSRHF